MIQTLGVAGIVKPELMGDVRLVDVETQVGVDISANRAVMQKCMRSGWGFS